MKPAPPEKPAGDRDRAASGAPVQLEGRSEPPQNRRPVQPSVPEIGGPKGPEPTRYGDWEKGGRCIDF
jgi:hypothetical protein